MTSLHAAICRLAYHPHQSKILATPMAMEVLYNSIVIDTLLLRRIYPPVTGQRQTIINFWTIRALFIAITNLWFEVIRSCLEFSSNPMFLRLSLHFCPLNLLLVRSHQTEIIIVKRLIQRTKNNLTMMGVELRFCNYVAFPYGIK